MKQTVVSNIPYQVDVVRLVHNMLADCVMSVGMIRCIGFRRSLGYFLYAFDCIL